MKSLFMTAMLTVTIFASSCNSNKEEESKIETALERAWAITNMESPIGAESCNVFRVKIQSNENNKVTVTYDLRSTYNGKKKFVTLTGELEKQPDGSYKVTNIGY